MNIKITYWTASDSIHEYIANIDVTDEMTDADFDFEVQAIIDALADDPQAPLAQVKDVELVVE